MSRLRHMFTLGSAGLAAFSLVIGAPVAAGAAGSPAAGRTIYVSPHGSDANSGLDPGHAVATVARAQQLVRSLDGDMTGDITVQLASGTYRLAQPLSLGAEDSGTNGYNVVWRAAPGAHPVLSGATRITGWRLSDPGKGIWAATVPAGLQTRQFYVNGVRADVASGPLPVTLKPTATGYTASSTALDSWGNPSQVEFVYTGGEGYWSLGTGGLGAWTEPRCPVAIPRPGQDMATADAEAPVLQTLVSGDGTAAAPVHNIVFSGIQFSYATWLQPSTPGGFSEIQANYTITGPGGYATQGLCQFAPGGTCPYGNWTQEPGNVDFGYDQDVQFLGDAFTHLGAAGLRLGDGSQGDTVQGSVFTDISGNGLELGGVDNPEPTAAVQDTKGSRPDGRSRGGGLGSVPRAGHRSRPAARPSSP
jgi:hypothetical protein